MRHYTEKLRELRQDRDLKQETVAKMLGITKQQYSLYETGRRKLPIDLLIELCRFYGTSSDYILCLPDNLKHPRK